MKDLNKPKKKKKKRPRGRPRTRRLRFQIKLLPEIDKFARQRAAELGIAKSHYIEELIREKMELAPS